MKSDIGIYKITNNINKKCYVGQSGQIHKRWMEHISLYKNKNSDKYDYPLYADIRKYGIENFTFEIIEYFDIYNIENQLKREAYWTNIFNAQYNQTYGKNNNITSSKISEKQADEIKNILLNDTNNNVSHKYLAEKYNVSKDTIRDINVGRSWYDENLSYPLRISKYDPREKHNINKGNDIKYCQICGCEISKYSKYCTDCRNKLINKNSKCPPKEELESLIYECSFVEIGKIYGVSDNAVRKWCKKYGLPFKYRDIHPIIVKEKVDFLLKDYFILMKNEKIYKSFTIDNAVDFIKTNYANNTSERNIQTSISNAIKNNKKYFGFNWYLGDKIEKTN